MDTSITRLKMGMPVSIFISDKGDYTEIINKVFDFIDYVDNKFSTYKEDSEVSQISRGEINTYSYDMKEVLLICEQTKLETGGYFDVFYNNKFDPSGVVKGWAIKKASEILDKYGINNYFVDAGGDIQIKGKNKDNNYWSVGIKNPFKQSEIVKVLKLTNIGIATSGTYIRGNHIYDPVNNIAAQNIQSITVLSSNVLDADRMATAAFAMGENGINFIEKLSGYEGYMIKNDETAVMTSNFGKYIF